MTVLTSIDPKGVATLTLNRPNKYNAFDSDMIAEITSILDSFNNNPAVRIIILQGAGKHFSVGADLNWMRSMASFTESENFEDAKALAMLMHNLYFSPKPTVCVVQGKTFGGGVGLVACCQCVIALDDAQFCFSEAKLGIIPAVISPYVIDAIGPRWARYYFLTASVFTAQDAYKIGLCHQVVSQDALQHTQEQLINALLSNGPHALIQINELVNRLDPLKINTQLAEDTAHLIARLRVSPEGQTGLNAFLNKSTPDWNS